MYFTVLLRSVKPRAVLLLGMSLGALCCWPVQASAAADDQAPSATPPAAAGATRAPVKYPAARNKSAKVASKVAAAPAAPDPAGVAALTGAVDAAAPAAAAGSGNSWDIVMADKTLNGAMARWAAAAGWQLSWELPVDYAVQARTSVPGSFEEAVAQVVNSMEGAEIPMQAIFYKGNKVLRVLAKGAR